MRRTLIAVTAVAIAVGGSTALAATLGADFSDYTVLDLGPIDGVPPPYGGLTLKADDPNILLIGGAANELEGAIYQVELTRDGDGKITGFAGPATLFARAPYIDGGLDYFPGTQVLAYTGWPTNEIGQILPGSDVPDRIDVVTPLGIESSVGSLGFTPAFAPGAGQLRVLSYDGGGFYTVPYELDAVAGDGTYQLGSAVLGPVLGGGPEGILYVPPGSPGFTGDNALVAKYDDGVVSAYEVDASGVIVAATVRTFLDGLDGAEGAFLDPDSGQFLFSTFGTDEDRVFAVSGFAPVVTTTTIVTTTTVAPTTTGAPTTVAPTTVTPTTVAPTTAPTATTVPPAPTTAPLPPVATLPQTGDDAAGSIALMALAALAAGAALVATTRRRSTPSDH